MSNEHHTPPGWHVFPYIMVRCAGLPYTWLLDFQAAETTKLVRQILDHEHLLSSKRARLLELLRQQGLSSPQRLPRNAYRRAEQAIKRLQPLFPGDSSLHRYEEIAQWNAVAQEYHALLAKGALAFQQERKATERLLSEYANQEVLQEGIFINSPTAFAAAKHFAQSEDREGARRRRLITRYLQRFCAKNDTNSFFGPINYARFIPEIARSLKFGLLGNGLAAKRQVRMSYWAAQLIADTWAQDLAFTPVLRLYRNARQTFLPNDPNLSKEDYQILEHADGRHTLLSLAESLAQPWEQVAARVDSLANRGYLRTGLLLPAYCHDPLKALEDLVQTFPAEIAANTLLDQLHTWRQWQKAFEQAALPERERLLAEGETFFTQITGKPARRQGVQDRLIYNEEVVGNIIDCQIGGSLAERLTNQLPLALDLLASQAIMLRQFQHRILLERIQHPVSAASLFQTSLSTQEAQDRYVSLWRALIRDSNVREVQVTRDDLWQAGLLLDNLERWPLYCAPDVMLRAPDFAALEQGNFSLVLAESHNILPPAMLPFLAFHPQAEVMANDVLREVQALVAPARPTLTAIERQNKAVDLVPLDHTIICLDWVHPESGADSVALADVLVGFEADGTPLVQVIDHPTPLALFPDYWDAKPNPDFLQPWAIPALDKRDFSLGAHTPRIIVGGVVYQRERWDLEARDLLLPIGAANSFDDFLALWRWKETHRMPDQVFVRLTEEDKPFLLDFRSISSCQAYLHDIRQATKASFTEMLPTPEELWFEIDDERYCCELRMTLFRHHARFPEETSCHASE